jgi:sulfite exporter TauE/SafE
MTSRLAEGFFLGLATGTTCLATCGPVYAPYLMQYERGFLGSLFALLEVSAGRFLAYLAIGAAAGILGKNLAIADRDLFLAASYVLFSAFLLVTSFRTHRREKCCPAGRWTAFADRPLFLGILTGINFCPSLFVALTRTIDLSGPAAGMTLFAAFFAGTTLFMLPVTLFGWFGTKQTYRVVARVAAVAVAAWFIGLAGFTVYRHFTEAKNTAAASVLTYEGALWDHGAAAHRDSKDGLTRVSRSCRFLSALRYP